MFKKELWSKVSGLEHVSSYPSLPCPYCGSESLRLDLNSFSTRKLSGHARAAYMNKFTNNDLQKINSEDSGLLKALTIIATIADTATFEPHQFIAFFKCNMCHENVSATGYAKVPKDRESKLLQIKIEKLSPPISLFPINSSTPQSVNKELISSFNHFFSDTCSAGNSLRRAIERVCDELGYSNANLHRSIESMAKAYPQEANWLMSLKLVGNEATHADNVSESDLLDSYQVFEVVLDIFRRLHLEPKIDNTVARIDSKFKKI